GFVSRGGTAAAAAGPLATPPAPETPPAAPAPSWWALTGLVAPVVFVVLLFLCLALGKQRGVPFYLFDRLVSLPGGVSPLLPAFFLAMLLCTWCLFQLRRCHFLAWYRVPSPFPAAGAAPRFDALARAHGRMDEILSSPVTLPHAGLKGLV